MTGKSELAIFRAENLSGKRGGRVLFSQLNIALSAGDALLVSGRNGIGKSSLLRILSGLAPLHEGKLYFQNLDSQDDPENYRAQIAYLGHLNALKTPLSVIENIRYWALLYQQSDEQITMALDMMAIANLANTPVRLLSAGQRRRTALATMMATGRPLWLLDEPSAGLDSASKERLSHMIENHRNNGGMVIAVAHGDLIMPGAVEIRLTDVVQERTVYEEEAVITS